MDIYLDNAATTKIDPEVIAVMNKTMKSTWANPSSIHKKGQEARNLLEKSRKIIAKKINALPEEIIFTSSATEANNLAICGILKIRKQKQIIISAIEHPSIINLCKQLEKEGYNINYLRVDKEGKINLKELESSLTEETALVSIQHVNNEIGVIQDIQNIAKICKKKNIPFHTDAVQSFNKIPLNVKTISITAMSFSAHKIHGPKGIAALYLKKGTKIKPLFFGGWQEQGLRPGTENLPGIVGFATATTLPLSIDKIKKIMTYLEKRIKDIQRIIINSPKSSIPTILNVSIDGIEAETLVKHLNHKGIFISTGSACSSNIVEPSYVLKALGLSDKQTLSSIRISLSKNTSKMEIDETIKHLKAIVPILRKL